MQTRKIILAIVSILTLTVTIAQSADIKVSGGEDHTLVLTENKFVWGWNFGGIRLIFQINLV